MMRRRILVALAAVPLGVAGWLFARPKAAAPYICPLTGEILPCPDCCPINGRAADNAPRSDGKDAADRSGATPDCCSK